MLLPETHYGHCSTGTLARYTMVIFSVRGSQVEQKSSLCSPPPLLCGHHAGVITHLLMALAGNRCANTAICWGKLSVHPEKAWQAHTVQH